MPSTFATKTAYAAHTFTIFSLLAAGIQARHHDHSTSSHTQRSSKRALNAMTYEGCFSSSAGLTDQGSYTYQTSGYCQPICVNQNQAVLGLSNGSNCWCGDVLPPASSKVDDSNCNTPCNGYGSQDCGGTNFWSVYLSGTEDSVPNYSGSGSSSAASSTTPPASTAATAAATSTTAASTTSAASADSSTTGTSPSVVTSVTSISAGSTVVVTEPASQSTSAAASTNDEHKGSNTTAVAGVAAGVVVGVLAAVALVAGLVFWLRRKRRQAAEDEYKRSTQVSDFMRGNHEPKPPNTGYSNMSDSRLDPERGQRNSAGSIADDQDYSRRILRVANPDSS